VTASTSTQVVFAATFYKR